MNVLRLIFFSMRRSSVATIVIFALLVFNSIFMIGLRLNATTPATKQLLKNVTLPVKTSPPAPRTIPAESFAPAINESFPEVPPIQENLIAFFQEPTKFCQNTSTPQILVVVHSSVDNFKNREVIRRTIGKYNSYNTQETKVMFVTGMSGYKPTMLKLESENLEHGDVLTISVRDRYTRLVYKAVGWMKWVVSACGDVKHVIKIDDDTFLNMFKLSKLFESCDNGTEKPEPICSKMSCLLWKNFKPHRKGKYSLSVSEYSNNVFPPFCPGVAVFIPGELVSRLLDASRYVQFLWLDDVYLTGLLMHYLRESHYNFGHKITNTLVKNYKYLDIGKMFVGHFKNDVLNGVYEKHWKVIENKWMNKKT